MAYKYKAGYGPRKKNGPKVFVVIFISLLIFGAIGGFLYWDTSRNKSEVVQGTSISIAQEEDIQQAVKKTVDEPLFIFELPPDWKETDRRDTNTENSITWQATKKKEDNRWLKIYIDIIPQDLAFNRLLPVVVSGNKLSYGQMSGNCKEFTTTKEGTVYEPVISRWQGIDFLCDIPKWVQNNVGVGVKGSKNPVKIKGLTKGEHKYMFAYTDHNIQPDYSILYHVIDTFEAK